MPASLHSTNVSKNELAVGDVCLVNGKAKQQENFIGLPGVARVFISRLAVLARLITRGAKLKAASHRENRYERVTQESRRLFGWQ